MTLQERQQKEIEALNREIQEIKDSILEDMLLSDKEEALKQVTEDPETYFKNIDEEE
jgi:hypothetical protein